MTAEEKCARNTEYAKAWRKRNPEKVRERNRRYRRRNSEKDTTTTYLWRTRNIERVRKTDRKKSKKAVSVLTNSYIASILGISVKYLSKELIEAKREHMKLNRLLKEKRCVENSAR